MNNFIIPEDYDASIRRDILDSLLRGDSTTQQDKAVIEVCEDRAVSEMRSYLSKTYDCDAIFSASGDNRHPLILMMAIDICVYHIFCLHNPYKMSQMRKDRYDRAIDWLKAVASGKITIDGAPRLPEDQQKGNSPWQIISDDYRHMKY